MTQNTPAQKAQQKESFAKLQAHRPDNWTGALCNAANQRSNSFCQYPAGWGTDHLGDGRCYVHGGKGQNVPAAVKEVAPYLVNRVRKLSANDAESLMQLGTAAMVVARSDLLARLITPGISAREANDLTMAVSRLDNLLAKHQDSENPDAPSTSGPTPVDSELARMMALEEQHGA